MLAIFDLTLKKNYENTFRNWEADRESRLRGSGKEQNEDDSPAAFLSQPPEVLFGGCRAQGQRTTAAYPMMGGPRVRIRFRKQGDLRWLGHRDLVRVWERLFRRSGIALSYSQGFHPKPKMSFPLALAVGIEGLEEVMEVELAEGCSTEELRAKLAASAPPGLEIIELTLTPPGAAKPRVRAVTYQIPLPPDRWDQTAKHVERWIRELHAPRRSGEGQSHSDLPASLEAIRLDKRRLEFTLRVLPEGGPGARDVLAALELADLETQGAVLTRTQVELVSGPPWPNRTRGRS